MLETFEHQGVGLQRIRAREWLAGAELNECTWGGFVVARTT